MHAFVRSSKAKPVAPAHAVKQQEPLPEKQQGAPAADADADANAATKAASPAAANAAGPAPMWLEDDSLSADERQLRQFDLDKRFGPCVGMTRTERWRRAEELGLAPPAGVLALLQQAPEGGGVGAAGQGAAAASERCLWEGRV